MLEASNVLLLRLGSLLLELVLPLFENLDRPSQPLSGSWIGVAELPQCLGITTEASPPHDGFINRLFRRREVLKFTCQRLETARCGLGQHPTTLAGVLLATHVLKPEGQRGSVIRRHPWQHVPLRLQFGDTIHRFRSCEAGDLFADSEAIRLLGGQGPGPIECGGLIPRPLGNGLSGRLAGRIETSE